MTITRLRTAGWPLHLAVPLFLVGLTACGGADTSQPESTGSLDGPDVDLAATLEPLYSVGSFDGEEWETFSRVSNVSFDANGRLFILDSEVPHVVVLNPDGTFSHTIGQRGDGPGEFQQIFSSTVFPDGRLVAYDFGKQGFQVFNPDGSFLESVPFDLTMGGPGSDLLPLSDGTLISHSGFTIRSSDDGDEAEEPSGRPIDRFRLADREKDEIYRAWEPPPTDEGEAQEIGNAVLQMNVLRAFDPELHLTASHDGLIGVADSTGYRVKMIGVDGIETGTLQRPIPPTVVTSTIQDQERQRRIDEVEDQVGELQIIGGGGISVDAAAIRRMQRDRIDEMVFADEIPVITGLAMDWGRRFWIERAGSEIGSEGPTDLVTPEGEYLGTIAPDGVRIPDAFGPDGLVAYIETDELDVASVRVGRVVLPGS